MYIASASMFVVMSASASVCGSSFKWEWGGENSMAMCDGTGIGGVSTRGARGVAGASIAIKK